jgi:hypothetical protein
MNKKKPTPGGRAKKKAEVSLVRSSAAEYLTFVAASGQGGVEAVYADENVWLTQKMMGLLYDVDVRTISYHLKNVFADHELEENSVIQYFRITAADGKAYDTGHYNLSAIIAVGYKVNSERALQFRKWATGIIESFTIKGYAMDDERLKNDGSILGKKYFEEQLQRIREIRLSERKFYQKITDIYATSIDYDVTASAYLDVAEDMALRQIPMTMQDWETRLNRFIAATDREILQDAGKVTAEIALAHAESEFEEYRIVQDRLFESDFDQPVKKLPPQAGKP